MIKFEVVTQGYIDAKDLIDLIEKEIGMKIDTFRVDLKATGDMEKGTYQQNLKGIAFTTLNK